MYAATETIYPSMARHVGTEASMLWKVEKLGFAVAATAFIAFAMVYGVPQLASARAEAEPVMQIVDRSHKGDRLSFIAVAKTVQVKPGPGTGVPEGCDPAFSPLAVGGADNFPARCLS
jgi:hypothetical protein